MKVLLILSGVPPADCIVFLIKININNIYFQERELFSFFVLNLFLTGMVIFSYCRI